MLKKIITNQNFLYICCRYIVMAIQFIGSLFVAARLGVYHYGIWSFIVLLVNWGCYLNFGVGSALTVFFVQQKDDMQQQKSYIYNSFVIACLIAACCVFFLLYERVFGIPLFNKYNLGNYIYIVTACVFLQQLSTFFINLMRLKNDLTAIVIQQGMWPIVMLMAIFIATGRSLMQIMVVAFLLSSLLACVILFIRSSIDFKCKLNLTIARNILKKGWFLFINNVSFAMITYSTQLIVSNSYSVREFGYYSFALTLATGVIMLIDSLVFLFYPKLLNLLTGDNKSNVIKNITTLRSSYLICIYLFFLTMLIAQKLFFYLFPMYTPSSLLFCIILCSLVSYSNCFGYNMFLVAQNYEKTVAKVTFFTMCLNILVLLFMTKIMNVNLTYALLGGVAVWQIYSLSITFNAMRFLGMKKRKFMFLLFDWKYGITYWGTLVILCLTEHIGFLFIPLLFFISVSLKDIRLALKNLLLIFTNNETLKI